MLASPVQRLTSIGLAILLGWASVALGEESARDLRDQALADLRALRDQETDPPVLPHLRTAVASLERSLDQFSDADHILDPPQAIDNLRQAIDSCTVAAKEALAAGKSPLADSLKANAIRLAQAARRLAAVLLDEARGAEGVIDTVSRDANAAAIQTAQDEIERGDEQLQEQDVSFRRYNYAWARYDNAVNRYKAAWIAAQSADSFRLRLVSASEAPDPFSANGDGRREVCVLTARFQAQAAAGSRVRGEWTLSSGATRVRTVHAESDVPSGAGVVEFTAAISWDARTDGGTLVADGGYSWGFTAVLLEPGAPENPLAGSLTGDVTHDSTGPLIGAGEPPDGAILRESRPTIAFTFEDPTTGIASVALHVRGLDVTSQSTVGASTISFTPAEPLSDGQVDAVLTCANNAQIVSTRTHVFRIDTVPPEWTHVNPSVGAFSTNRREPFIASVTDAGSGVHPGSIRLFLDDIDVTSTTQVAQDLVTFTPDGLEDGTHTYRATAMDRAGNAAETLTTFEVVSAFVRVDPATGGPVTVTDSSSPIFGASIEIPAGAVLEPTTVTIEAVPDALPFPDGAVPGGPAVRMESTTGDFVADVFLRIPYDEETFTAAGLSEEAAVLFVLEDATSDWVEAEIVSIDTAANVVVARRRSLSVFRVGYLVPDPSLSTVAIVPASFPVATDGLVVVTLRTANGVRIGRGHNVTARLVSGQGTIGPFTFQLDGTYGATLRAPDLVGSAVVEATADGVPLARTATAQYLPGPAARFLLSAAPPSVVAGTTFAMTLTAQDRFGNLSTGHRGSARVTRNTDPQMQIDGADSPWTLVFGDASPGVVNFTVRYRSAGTQSFRVEDPSAVLFADSGGTSVEPAGPSTLTIVQGDGQTGTVGTTLVEGLRVRVIDEFGNGVPGTPTDFAVTLGGGGIAAQLGDTPVPGPLTVTSDGLGEAEVFLTLGSSPGVNQVSARVPSVGAPVVFTATGQAPQAVQVLDLFGVSRVPVEGAAALFVDLSQSGAPVDGEANNLELFVESTSPPGLVVALGVFTGLGNGRYSVDVTAASPGTATIRARWNGGQVTSLPHDVTWFAPDTIFAAAEPVRALVGQQVTILIQLREQGVGVPDQERSLRVAVRAPAPPDKYLIDDVTAVGGGDYQCKVRSAIANDPNDPIEENRRTTFDVFYDLAGTTASPDLGTSVNVIFDEPHDFPHIVAWTPPDRATDVAHDAVIRLTFDRVMDTRRTATSNISVVRRDGPEQFAHILWAKLPFPAYNAANGETRVACGDVDGDGRDEVVAGIGTYTASGGWAAVFDDARPSSVDPNVKTIRFLRWIRIPFSAYNSANGEVRPAVGDMDRDGRAEVVLGIGAHPASGGWLAVFDDARTGFAFIRWARVPWYAYNTANGATRPALGDFDGDGADEIATGLDRLPGGSRPNIPGGFFAVHDDLLHANAFMRWSRITWTLYNSAVGESRPAAGDVDGDNFDEVILGLGPYPENGGYCQIKDDIAHQFQPVRWIRLPQRGSGALPDDATDYNRTNGETWPACGDLDADGIDEIALGMGAYPGGGYVWTYDDKRANVPGGVPFLPLGSTRLTLPDYNAAVGETRPAIGNVVGEPVEIVGGGAADGDAREEIVVGLGTYEFNKGLIQIFNGSRPIAVQIEFQTEVVGDVTRTVALVRPEQQFLPGETYEMRVSGMFDLANRPFNQGGLPGDDGNGGFLSTFTVAPANADTFSPRVTDISPPPDSSIAAPGSHIVVHFSEPVNPATVTPATFQLRRGTSYVFGTITVEEGDRVARFVPQALGEGDVYTIILTSGITDQATPPNPLVHWESQFRVTSTNRPTPPVIVVPPEPGPTQRWRRTRLTFIGTAEPGGEIRFFEGTVELARANVPMSGRFEVQVPAGQGAFADGAHAVYARVRRADGADVWSGDSRVVRFTIDTTPPAPVQGLTATAGDGFIDLAWEPNDEDDLLGYMIYRRRSNETAMVEINPFDPSNPARRLPIKGTRFRDRNVENGVIYVYEVRAVDSAEPEEP